MTPKEKALAWVDEHFDECLAELKNAVACESYAGNEAGLEKMRNTLEADLRRAGFTTARHPVEGGNALISASRSAMIGIPMACATLSCVSFKSLNSRL